MREIIVSAREEGGTLLKLLGKYLKDAPNSFFYKMLRKKNITLNKKKAQGKEKLAKDDVICLFLSDETIRQFGGAAWLSGAAGDEGFAGADMQQTGALAGADGRQTGALAGADGRQTGAPTGADGRRADTLIDPARRKPEIVYEDEDVLLVNKPAGWLTQKAMPGDFSLNEWVAEYMLSQGSITREELSTFRPGVCNRLDRNTSGIVSAGKTLAGLQFLSEAFRERALHKYYTCIVTGEIKAAARMDGYLKKDEKENRVHILPVKEGAGTGYERVCAAYRPLAAKDGFTYLEVELITGKTHQIRAQLAAEGYAVLGDAKYAQETDRVLARKYHLKHQLLHAGRIVFGEYAGRFSYLNGREFTAREPEAFRGVKEQLGFSSGDAKKVP